VEGIEMTYRRRYELAMQFLTDRKLNKEFKDYCFKVREKKRRKKGGEQTYTKEQPLHGKILLKAIDVAIGNSSLDSGEVRILQIIRWLINRGIFDADVKWCDRCELWKPPTHSCFIQDKDEPKKEQIRRRVRNE